MVTREVVQPEQFKFKDDGVFPNSVLPLLVYRQALMADGHDGEADHIALNKNWGEAKVVCSPYQSGIMLPCDCVRAIKE